jgi:hypothetical protein
MEPPTLMLGCTSVFPVFTFGLSILPLDIVLAHLFLGTVDQDVSRINT